MANAVHEFEPNFTFVHTRLGYSYSGKGMYAEAVTAFQDAIKAGDNTASTQSIWVWLTRGRASASGRRRFCKQLQTTDTYVSPGELPVLYAALGEREQAFASLEKAYAAHDLQLQYLGVDPGFDSLRSDPRFQDLLRRVGLPE